MNRNLTVSVRALLVAVLASMLVLSSLVIAYQLGGDGTAAHAAEAPQPVARGQQRELTMTGTGEAGAVPDQLSFTLSVGVTRPDLDAALGAANGTMARVLGTLKQHGVGKSDVQTTGLSMTPVYDYHQYSPPTVVGYRVSERASVLVKDLAEGGKAVSAAVATGGNDVRVGGIRLLVGDTDAVMKRARDAAVAEATAKAQQYAEASGQTLGDVLTLREVHARPLPSRELTLQHAYAMDTVSGLKALPVRAGRDQSSVTVKVVWALS